MYLNIVVLHVEMHTIIDTIDYVNVVYSIYDTIEMESLIVIHSFDN